MSNLRTLKPSFLTLSDSAALLLIQPMRYGRQKPSVIKVKAVKKRLARTKSLQMSLLNLSEEDFQKLKDQYS